MVGRALNGDVADQSCRCDCAIAINVAAAEDALSKVCRSAARARELLIEYIQARPLTGQRRTS